MTRSELQMEQIIHKDKVLARLKQIELTRLDNEIRQSTYKLPEHFYPLERRRIWKEILSEINRVWKAFVDDLRI